jgi:DNA-binding CsgD family transcriptional regulator
VFAAAATSGQAGATSGQVAGVDDLVGREQERAVLDTVLDAARSGTGASLVLAGEAGAGKSALLREAARRAEDMSLVWLPGPADAGPEPGSIGRAFGPLLKFRSALLAPLRAALSGGKSAPLGAGLAMLALLAAASQQRPLLCVADDADLLAPAVSAALAVAARRVGGSSVAMIFAVRTPGQPFDDLPSLRVGGLSAPAADLLLDRLTKGTLDPWTRERLALAASGNPQCLTYLAARYTAAELGRIALAPVPAPVDDRLLEHFGADVRGLPADTRSLLLTLAAAPDGNVTAAGPALGFDADSWRPAARAGVLVGWPQPRFAHPLIRSAVYFGAPPRRRRRAHEVLAGLPGQASSRAWHRAAHALPGADETLASELADTAKTVVAPSERCLLQVLAGELSGDPGTRAVRYAAGAHAALIAGASSYARVLAGQAEAHLGHNTAARASAAAVREQARAELGQPSRRPTAAWQLEAARAELPAFPAASRDSTLRALSQVLLVRDGSCGITPTELARQMAAVTAALGESTDLGTLLLIGFGRLMAGDYASAARPLRQALTEAASPTVLERGVPGWFPLVAVAALALWDDSAAVDWLHRVIEQARAGGAPLHERRALGILQHLQAAGGRLTDARACAEEIAKIRSSDCQPDAARSALVPAWQGDRAAVLAASELTASGRLPLMAEVSYGLAGFAPVLSELGESRFPAALRAANDIRASDTLNIEQEVLPYLVEAAAACGRLDQAHGALRVLRARAVVANTDWALGQLYCSEGVLADGDAVDAAFGAAISSLRRTRRTADLARAHLLYGEALAGQGRSADSGAQLRIAEELFSGCGAAAFARRARRALRAVGERPASREPAVGDELTGQELRVARLAASGATNRDIGDQLFIAASTVTYHLGKVYRKLGVSSRRALGEALAERLPGLPGDSNGDRTEARERWTSQRNRRNAAYSAQSAPGVPGQSLTWGRPGNGWCLGCSWRPRASRLRYPRCLTRSGRGMSLTARRTCCTGMSASYAGCWNQAWACARWAATCCRSGRAIVSPSAPTCSNSANSCRRHGGWRAMATSAEQRDGTWRRSGLRAGPRGPTWH